MTYLKRTITMSGKAISKTIDEFYAVGEDTVKVRHFNQEGERSSYEISTYSTKEAALISDAQEISEQEFVSAIQKASDIIKARVYE